MSGFHEACLPTAVLPAQAVPVRMAVGFQCRDSVGLETGCGQGGLVAQGPGLPEREERKTGLWVLEEL